MSVSIDVLGHQPDRYAHLRAHAATAKQRTVARLRAAIVAIEGRGGAVTTATIKQECGLDYSAYYRNDEAYALYQEHAAHFTPRLNTAKTGRRRRRAPSERPASAPRRKARDPLLAYRRPELAAKVRGAWAARDTARAERDDAVRRYENLLREHLQCAQTIFTLQTKLIQYEEHRDYLRRTMQEREHHP
jgi:hypothetical protein